MLSLKHWQNQRAEFEAAGVRLPALDVEKAAPSTTMCTRS